jgi:glycosyltransferase involved in cell wall biosynthesis
MRGREDYSYPATRRLVGAARRYDVVHLHNLHGAYFDLRQLPALCRAAPVALTLHDAWLLAGHCVHSFDCERWRNGCGDCPRLGTYQRIRRDSSVYNYRLKEEIYADCRYHVCSPSKWLLDRARQSILSRGASSYTYIPNGVDVSVYRPRPRAEARRLLGLPEDGEIVMMMAGSIHKNEWKDPETLRAAISTVARARAEKVRFIAVGESSPPEMVGAARVEFAPYQPDPEKLALYYQAADVYVHSARAETASTVIYEAMACATPVVATGVCGIPEQVEGGAGLLSRPGDAGDMASKILEVLRGGGDSAEMGRSGRRKVEAGHTIEQCVAAYLKWYEKVRT